VGKYFSEDVGGASRDAVEEVVLGWPEVTAGKMFGCPSYRAAGTLFVFVTDEGVVLTKLSEDERARADEELDAEVFVGHQGDIDKWRVVKMDGADASPLAPFLRMAYERALTEE
jgi:hypothetical protein